MMNNHGPTICQMIGEPHNHTLYIDCLKCKIKTCPINKIFWILELTVAPKLRENVQTLIKGENMKTQEAVEYIRNVLKSFRHDLPAKFMDDVERVINSWDETLLQSSTPKANEDD